jgi:hypothetical protein
VQIVSEGRFNDMIDSVIKFAETHSKGVCKFKLEDGGMLEIHYHIDRMYDDFME